MTHETQKAFEKNVVELYRARWDSRKIARWAATPEAFGHHVTEEEAHELILPIFRRLNHAQSLKNRLARREWMTANTEIVAMARRVGMRVRR